MLISAEYPDAEREKLLLLAIPKSPKLSMLKNCHSYINIHSNWLMVEIPRFLLSPIPAVSIRRISRAPLNIARNNVSSNLQLAPWTPWQNHATWYFLTFPVLVHHLQDSCWPQPTGPTQWIYCRHWYKISKQWFNTILEMNNNTCIYL